MRDKHGAVNWTIGKLINIVLLVLVMVLIIYGLTTGGLNPLIKNIEGKFNEVLVMFNIKDDVSTEACFSAEVAELGGGEVFLRDVGLGGKSVTLNVCRNRMCNFTGGWLAGQRTRSGVYEVLGDQGWERGITFNGNPEVVKFNWQVYNEVYGVLKSAEGLEFLMNPRATPEFILYGDKSWTAEPIVATWRNGIWMIEVGGKTRFIKNDDEAIDLFVKNVWGRGVAVATDDSEVSFVDDSGVRKDIGELVGNYGWFSSSNELDSEKEVEILKAVFAEKKAEYLQNIPLSDEEVENLTRVVGERGEIIVAGETFKLGVSKNVKEVVITLDSANVKLGMMYDVRGFPEEILGCKTNSLPLVFVEWDGSSWEERDSNAYYKLEERCFNDVYRKSVIGSFLTQRCK